MRARKGQGRVQTTRTEVWPAPVVGWVTSGAVVEAPKNAAELLDNFFPRAQSVRMRNGYVLHATLGANVVRMLPYEVFGNAKLFAATSSGLFEISSPADPEVSPVASLEGLSSGDWSGTNFRTSGGSFLIAVNGVNSAIYFDGADIFPIVGAAVNEVAYDGLTDAFTVGQMVTGGTSGASATILSISPTSATAGVLRLGAITSGPFEDDEALTDGGGGAATADGASDSASAVTITGVDTDDLSHVWQFKERLFFIEKNTLKAWFLPVDSIGGAAGELNFGSVFRLGGSLLFGATWSLDSGDGLDDKCVFVTDAGEVAVYEGTNPGSAATWALVGVYRIGRPVNKHGYFPAGGELYILTDEGIVGVSESIQADRATLLGGTLTANIRDAWQDAVTNASTAQPLNATVWPAESMLLIGTALTKDGVPLAYVANARTNSWCRFTNYDIRCGVVFQDAFYFASDGGVIYQGEVGGTDAGTAYTAYCVPKFSEAGVPNIKIANHAGLLARAQDVFNFSMQGFSDYELANFPAPQAIGEASSASVWGTGTWGSAVWGGGFGRITQQRWKTVSAQGFSVSPGVAITCNRTPAPEIEILAMQLRYEIGSVL